MYTTLMRDNGWAPASDRTIDDQTGAFLWFYVRAVAPL